MERQAGGWLQDGLVSYQWVTASVRPDLAGEAEAAFRERWPEFIFHDPVPPAYLPRIPAYFAEDDVLLLDEGRVAAGGSGVPFAYNGDTTDLPEGHDGAFVRSVDDREAGRTPSALCFMAAAVHRDYDKQGLAQQVLQQLTERAGSAGLEHVFAPLRPTWKSKYPTVTMARYATWVREDGLSIDPWIRTHQRMATRIIGPAPDSMVIPGTVTQWETCAEMPFPKSGEYIIPEALNVLQVDRETDRALYRDENLWMEHDPGRRT